jgi:hypothetical protein
MTDKYATMKYQEKITLVKTALNLFCKEVIMNTYNNHTIIFNSWLKKNADIEFWYGYEKIFSEYFKKDMTIDLQDYLWISCKNLTYAVSSFIYIKERSGNQYKYNYNSNLEEILDFIEKFIYEQLDYFDNYLNNE